ncbi:MAG TPA: cytochrome c oxidase subunit II [Solirubrobacteraceae bacterium]|jgi:cytochrome c oxidase subunit 2
MAETHGAQSAPHRPAVPRQILLRLLGIGVLAAAIGILIGFLIPWFPPAAAKQAHTIDTLYYVLIVCTVPIFVLVTTVVLFSAWRFRVRPGEERLDGPPIHGNTHLEVIWTALPSALIAALVVYAAVVLHDIGVKQPGEMQIGVTGQQYEWTFSYPAYHDAQNKPIVTTDLYLPIHRPVVFEIRSVDVIHTFFVAAFRLQQDAVPGITTSFRATPDRLGSYPIVCNQLCGYGHSTMRTTLHIISAAAFQSFLTQHGYSGASTQTASLHHSSGAPAPTVADAANRSNPKEGPQ